MAKNQENSTIGKWISALYRLGSVYAGERLRPHRIGPGQIAILMTILHEEGLTQDEIARRLLMDKGTASKMLAQLDRANLVIKKNAEDDKRKNNVFASPRLKKLEKEIRTMSIDWSDIATSGFSSTEKKTVTDLLERMVDNSVEYLYTQRKKKGRR